MKLLKNNEVVKQKHEVANSWFRSGCFVDKSHPHTQFMRAECARPHKEILQATQTWKPYMAITATLNFYASTRTHNFCARTCIYKCLHIYIARQTSVCVRLCQRVLFIHAMQRQFIIWIELRWWTCRLCTQKEVILSAVCVCVWVCACMCLYCSGAWHTTADNRTPTSNARAWFMSHAHALPVVLCEKLRSRELGII